MVEENPAGPADEPAPVSKVALDAKRLRALAHPLRVRLVSMLRNDGPSTATALGRRLGENSANTSWHLRQLAEAGMVTEDTERGNRRERWWTASHEFTTHDGALAADPETVGSMGAYLHAVSTLHYDYANAYIAQMSSFPRKWREVADFSDMRLNLSATELAELNKKIDALMFAHRRPARAGDMEVVVQWHALPQRPAEPPR